MFQELGISAGTAIIILIALYFIIKWSVKNGIKEAYKDITGKKPALSGYLSSGKPASNFYN